MSGRGAFRPGAAKWVVLAGWTVLDALVAITALTRAARAQVPPHIPGQLCFTPSFWCIAEPAGPPGAPCACPTPYGYVGGLLD